MVYASKNHTTVRNEAFVVRNLYANMYIVTNIFANIVISLNKNQHFHF